MTKSSRAQVIGDVRPDEVLVIPRTKHQHEPHAGRDRTRPRTAFNVDSADVGRGAADPSACLGADEIERVGRVLESRWLGSGPVARAFEDRVAALCGAGNVVATSSGTVALQLALHGIDLQPGDEVVLPP